MIYLILCGVIALLLAFVLLHLNLYKIYYLNLRKLLPPPWSPEEVGLFYDEWTDKFLKSGCQNIIQAHRSQNPEEMLDYICESAGIRDGMHILDTGCGVCGPAIYFAQKKDIKIECVTISKVQYEKSAREITKHNLSHKITVHLHDFHHMEKLFEKKSFDLIYFLESYGHATYQGRALKSAYNILKPGGLLYIKDYFEAESHHDVLKNLRMFLGIRNMNRVYRYNLADLYFTIYILRNLKMNLVKIAYPDFKWDGGAGVARFEKENNIDLFQGKTIVANTEPLELLFSKPQ